jgi:transposase
MDWKESKNYSFGKMRLHTLSKEEIIRKFLELEKENEELKKQKEALEKELRKYKNPNTPSSAQYFEAKPESRATGRPRGAPKGHKGATLNLPEPDEIIPVLARECLQCHGTNTEPTGTIRKKSVVRLLNPKVRILRYDCEEIRCLDCHTLTLAKHEDIPEAGIYDKTIQSLVNFFKFKARMSHSIIVDAMNNIFGVPMTEPTSLEITKRASKKLAPKYENLQKKIRKADVVHADETSLRVMGINHWIWVFCNQFMTLFRFNKERGGSIVENTLGKNFKGKLVTDGWQTYNTYTEENGVVHSRCWAHSLREIKFECKKEYPNLYEWYCDIYQLVEKGRAYKQKKRRLRMWDKCKAELSMWVTTAKTHKNLRKLAGLIENGGDDWLTPILYPKVPLDNNEGERSLRPFVIDGKIMGCLRSETGKHVYEIMMSLVSTWKKQNKNVFYTLQTTL